MTINQFLSDFVAGFLTPVRLFFQWCNWMGFVVFTFIYTIVKLTYYALHAIFLQLSQMGTLYQKVSDTLHGGPPSGLVNFFVIINTFFPLDLVLVYLSLLIQLWMFWNIYRFAKSWIPTLT